MNSSMYWEQCIKCEFCEATFVSQDALKQHLRLHSRRKPYKCDECGAKFSYNSTLQWHKKSHTGELPFKCNECGIQFAQNSMLMWHRRKHELGECSQSQSSLVINVAGIYQQEGGHGPILGLPWNAVVSEEAVTHTSNTATSCTTFTPPGTFTIVNSTPATLVTVTATPVVLHQEVTTNKRKLEEGKEKIFYCDICGLLLCPTEFKDHMHTKHNMGDNNPFHILAKQQNNSQSEPKKKIVEKAFKCELCAAGFNTEGHLRSHHQRHLKQRPYKCEKCGLAFSDKVILESHERRHQAGRPFKCVSCGAAFFKESHLQRHMKRHTGELV